MTKKNLFWTLSIGGSTFLIGVFLFSAIRSISQISLKPSSEMQASFQELRQEGEEFWQENQEIRQTYQDLQELEQEYTQALKNNNQEKVQELEKEMEQIIQDLPDIDISEQVE